MKKIILTLALSLLSVVFADVFTVQVKGDAYKESEGKIEALTPTDIVSETDTIIVKEKSMVIITVNGQKFVLKPGAYKVSDLK